MLLNTTFYHTEWVGDCRILHFSEMIRNPICLECHKNVQFNSFRAVSWSHAHLTQHQYFRWLELDNWEWDEKDLEISSTSFILLSFHHIKTWSLTHVWSKLNYIMNACATKRLRLMTIMKEKNQVFSTNHFVKHEFWVTIFLIFLLSHYVIRFPKMLKEEQWFRGFYIIDIITIKK